MRIEPLVSVIMPVYNAERYIRIAVDSILSQTFRDFEFIIIDDGSGDNSKSILEEYSKIDSRICLISRANTGLSIALNEGISYSKGKYIARMDADDIALPERLESQVDFLNRNPTCIVIGSQVIRIDPDGWLIGSAQKPTSHQDIDSTHMSGKGGGSAIVHPTAMIRRNALQIIGGYRREMEPAEDLDLFLRLAEIGELASLPYALLKYRMHLKSIGHTRRKEQREMAWRVVREAHHRRGISLPAEILEVNDLASSSPSDIHRRWAWWALGSGYVETARKHAFRALAKDILSLHNWKVVVCSLRGF